MFTFLRKIRKGLLGSNQTPKQVPKYFLYAIGEIGLVVIGILIALQINNWNENQKLRKLELKIYKEIASDIDESHAEILLVTRITSDCSKRRQW